MRREASAGSIGGGCAVSAGSPLAAAAAAGVLGAGGNAVDAAIAGSMAQCVVEMPWCGIGGDAFALVVSPDGDVAGFNGSGAAPAGVLDVAAAYSKVPRFGPVSVAVPAIVDTWFELHGRYGSVPFAELCEPARRLAADGFVLDRRVARAISGAGSIEGADQLAPLFADLATVPGALFVQRDLGDTIEQVAESREHFYSGLVAKRIADHMALRGGALAFDDLAAHRGQWADPVATSYRDTTVYTNGLVSSGVLVLVGLRVLETLWPRDLPDDEVELTHALVQIKRLLFGSVAPRLGDPDHAFAGVPDVLGDGTIDELVEAMRTGRSMTTGVAAPAASDTTSLAVTAPDGSTVTFIHSLFNEFGSREVVPETGIVLNDRLANLAVVDPDRAVRMPNALTPGKRPLHTLHGYVVRRDDGRIVAGATPGGRGQVQTNLQVLTRMIDRRTSVQDAVSAARWVHGMPRETLDDDALYVEPGLAPLADALADRGHNVEIIDAESSDRFGNCTVVARHGDVLEAAADHRRGGKAIIP